MMEEDEWDEGPTTEDVIASVLKSKSKFGKIKFNLPPRHFKRPTAVKETTCNDDLSKSKTEELKSLMYGGGREGATLSVEDHQQFGSVSPREREKLDPNNYGLRQISASTSKMTRSVSTPEMGFKFNTKPPTSTLSAGIKPSASRQMNFTGISGARNKENTNPLLKCDLLEERNNDTQESVLRKIQEGDRLTQEARVKSYFSDDEYNILSGGKSNKCTVREASYTGDTLKSLFEQKPKHSTYSENVKTDCNWKPTEIRIDPAERAPLVAKAEQAAAVTQSGITTSSKVSPDVLTSSQTLQGSMKANIPTSRALPVNHGNTVVNKPAVSASVTSTRNGLPPVAPSHGSGAGMKYSMANQQTIQKTPSTVTVSSDNKRSPTEELLQTRRQQQPQPHPFIPSQPHPSIQPQPHPSIPSQPHLSTPSHPPPSINSHKHPPIQSQPSVQPHPPIQKSTTPPDTSGRMQGSMASGSHPDSGVMRTPSNKRPQPRPPTPPTTHKIQQMDHLRVNGQEYLKLGLVGRGGSSKVYEVLDLETRQVKAIKVVELEGVDDATLQSYKNEIDILLRLQWSDRVIRLHDYELTDNYLKLVMEKGNRDLASILNSARGKNAKPISPFTIQHYWQGMLLAVQAIHQEGIIHSDLKPANFLLVNETVKLIDFGIASSIQQDMTSVIKDSQAGTFNYMSPESLMDVHSGPIINGRSGDRLTIKIGVLSDVWSLGCILYNLVYGRTPFQHLSNPLQKLAAISDPNTKINFPDIEDKPLLDVIQRCLTFDQRKRPSILQLLEHPYLCKPRENLQSPKKDPQLKSVMHQLAQLTPNSLSKITSIISDCAAATGREITNMDK